MGNIQQYDFGDATFITSICTSKPYADVEAIVKRILMDHGATIEEGEQHWTVHFPKGTQRIEIWLRADSTRFRIRFPDHYQIYETVTCYGVSICAIHLMSFHRRSCTSMSTPTRHRHGDRGLSHTSLAPVAMPVADTLVGAADERSTLS